MPTWRPLQALLHDAVDASVSLVREGHDATGRTVLRAAGLIPGLQAPAQLADDIRRASTAATLGSVTRINRLVEAVSGAALDAADDAGLWAEGPEAPVVMRSDVLGAPAWARDAVVGMLNGAVGDHLARRGNGLDLGLTLRVGDRYLDDADASTVSEAGDRLVVLTHGLSTTEWSWCLDAERFLGDPAANFGTLLARDRGLQPVYARYNSGRPIATNARALARAIDRLVQTWPVPVRQVVLLGHSMGGLVQRGALVHADTTGLVWRRRVSHAITLGTPHQGAPLARFGATAASTLDALDHPASKVIAKLILARSDGIRNLEHAETEDAARPLLDDVAYAFLSGTLTTDPDHPLGRFFGDLLVQVSSAQGPAGTPITTSHATFGGVLHHELQTHPDVYAKVRDLLTS